MLLRLSKDATMEERQPLEHKEDSMRVTSAQNPNPGVSLSFYLPGN